MIPPKCFTKIGRSKWVYIFEILTNLGLEKPMFINSADMPHLAPFSHWSEKAAFRQENCLSFNSCWMLKIFKLKVVWYRNVKIENYINKRKKYLIKIISSYLMLSHNGEQGLENADATCNHKAHLDGTFKKILKCVWASF